MVASTAQEMVRAGAVAGLAFTVWFAVVAIAAVVTRPRSVDPGEPALEPGGDEPAAIVNLLGRGWRLGPEAVPATLLDLAARGACAIEQRGVGESVVRTSHTRLELTSYERMVLGHVESLAHDGLVPCEALTTGPADKSRRWWLRFRAAVESDARERGLARRRWRPALLVVLSALAVVPAVAATYLAHVVLDNADDGSGEPVLALIGVPFAVYGALAGVLRALERPRDTDAGRAAAARWLALREYLQEDPVFADQPPAGVAVWDRILAYGAALGVARGAVRELPLGAESDTAAWTSVGGRWRVVEVRYPRLWPPCWGESPFSTFFRALLLGGVAAGGVWATTEFELSRSVESAAVAAAVAFAAFGAVLLFMSVADFFQRATVSGRAIRVRTRQKHRYVAVDAGSGDVVRAFRMVPSYANDVAQGADVRVEVTRFLRRVRSITVE